MNIDASKTNTLDSEHSIEFGDASRNTAEKLFRKRKDLNGKFDP